MSKAESTKIEARLHGNIFLFSLIGLILMVAWLFENFKSAPLGWFIAAILLAGAAVSFSVWNYREFKRLLNELEKA